MKLFCKSFVLYLLVLALMPCTDIHASQPFTSTIEANISDHDDCPHENAADFCSPFCMCNCCGQSVFLNITGKVSINKSGPMASHESNSFTYVEPTQSEFLDRLFHPPKV
ncbi:MAG TPA: DUF6660 family protein [Saprospiraceae bacterium]|nr:DUF6660 family protein [Saprospiraceae bacterium]